MRFLTLFSLVVGVSAQKAGPYTLEAQADQIIALPGLAKDVFAGFSGYLAINGTAPGSKKMHYWLQESLSAPLTGRFLTCWGKLYSTSSSFRLTLLFFYS